MTLIWFGLFVLLASTNVGARLDLNENEQLKNLNDPLLGNDFVGMEEAIPHGKKQPGKLHQLPTNDLQTAEHTKLHQQVPIDDLNGADTLISSEYKQPKKHHNQFSTHDLSGITPVFSSTGNQNGKSHHRSPTDNLSKWRSKTSHNISHHVSDALEKQYGEIIYAALIFRHGDRNPIYNYPLDPKLSSDKLGQLIDKGKNRMYNLGQWFKKRYCNLTGELYQSDRIFVESSDIDRTIMSAMCFLYGYFPATGTQIWKANETWQPIPVHTIPQNSDNMICMRRPCPRMDQLRETILNGPEFQLIYQQNKAAIDYIGTQLSLSFSNTSMLRVFNMMTKFYDTLNVQSQQHEALPPWAETIYPEPVRSIYNQMMSTWYGNTAEHMRLTAGPILKSIRFDMIQKVTNNTFHETLHIYSAHDSTIGPVMKALNVSTDLQPPYSSALMFELRKNGPEYRVTILYRNSTDGPLYLLNVPGCGLACTLKTFLNVTNPLVPEDWEEECLTNLNSAILISPRVHLISILLGILLFK